MNNTTKGPGHKNATYNYSSKAARSAKEDELIGIISCSKKTHPHLRSMRLCENKNKLSLSVSAIRILAVTDRSRLNDYT